MEYKGKKYEFGQVLAEFETEVGKSLAVFDIPANFAYEITTTPKETGVFQVANFGKEIAIVKEGEPANTLVCKILAVNALRTFPPAPQNGKWITGSERIIV